MEELLAVRTVSWMERGLYQVAKSRRVKMECCFAPLQRGGRYTRVSSHRAIGLNAFLSTATKPGINTSGGYYILIEQL